MRRLLREIAAQTAEHNSWLGERDARLARARLAGQAPGDHPARLRLLLEVGAHELRLGNDHEAITLFAEARALLDRLGEVIDAREATHARFRIGVAHLRHGETRNCGERPAAESCILPLRGGGIHTDQAGSRAAILDFAWVLQRTPESSPLFIKTVWLMNLAYMTIGGYPHDVPERHRIPPAVFASEPFARFPNVAPALGLATPDLAGGAVADDFDGDDDLDLLTTTMDTRGLPHFFRNRGDGTFEDATREAGLEGLYGGLNLVHADYDNDGDLDAYVLRGAWFYEHGRHPNSLWRNDGRARFTDVTFDAGLGALHLPTQTATWGDYDLDGDVDLFVGNEHGVSPDRAGQPEARFDAPSQLFRNQGNGTFIDVAEAAGVAVRAYVKGTAWGDYDNDRDPDLYLSVLGGDNLLLRNQGDGTFTEVAAQAGVQGPRSSFPTWFWDYDNDGNLDLFVATYAGAEDSVALVAASAFGLPVPFEPARLYRGDGRGGFEDRAAAAGLTRIHLAMGSNFGDLDGDGWLDFYLGTGYPDYEGLMPNVLYRNLGGSAFADVTAAAGMGHLQKGHAVACADFDRDGDLDVFEQMGGAYPGDGFADALYQNPGFGNHFLLLHLVGVRTNRAALGARIRVDVVERGAARSIHRHVTSGGSFGGNPLRQLIGLGSAERIVRVEIWWPASDTRQVFDQVPLDAAVRITEGRDELVLFGR